MTIFDVCLKGDNHPTYLVYERGKDITLQEISWQPMVKLPVVEWISREEMSNVEITLSKWK